MPISKNHRKNGKRKKNNAKKRAELLENADISSGVTLQDLIDVLAYQEYVKDGTIIAPNAKINVEEENEHGK